MIASNHSTLPAKLQDTTRDWWNDMALKRAIEVALAPFRTTLGPQFQISVAMVQSYVDTQHPRDLELAKRIAEDHVERWIRTRAAHVMAEVARPEGSAVAMTKDGEVIEQSGGVLSVPVTPDGNHAVLPQDVPWAR